MDIRPIGHIRSCYRNKFGTPRQPGLTPSSWAELEVCKDLHPEQALEGLKGFSHIWIIFYFHLNKTARYHAKVHPPRLGGDSLGVFATRSPHRPNPIGLSVVKLEKIEDSVLYLSGIDLVEGTPVLDIKPYLPQTESIPEARTGWVPHQQDVLDIEFSAEALQTIHPLSSQLKNLIVETLQLDPRPLIYKGFEGQSESPYRDQHAVRIEDCDVHFRFLTPQKIFVIQILLGITQKLQ